MKITYKIILILYITLITPHYAFCVPTNPEIKNQILEYIKQAENLDNNPNLSKIQTAVAYIETDLGKQNQLIGDNYESFGPFQIQIPTAKGIAEKHNIELPPSNKELANELVNNIQFSVLLSRLHLLDLLNKYNNLNLALVAYNEGEGSVDRKIKNKIQIQSNYLNRFYFYYNKLNPESTIQLTNNTKEEDNNEIFIIP